MISEGVNPIAMNDLAATVVCNSHSGWAYVEQSVLHLETVALFPQVEYLLFSNERARCSRSSGTGSLVTAIMLVAA